VCESSVSIYFNCADSLRSPPASISLARLQSKGINEWADEKAAEDNISGWFGWFGREGMAMAIIRLNSFTDSLPCGPFYRSLAHNNCRRFMNASCALNWIQYFASALQRPQRQIVNNKVFCVPLTVALFLWRLHISWLSFFALKWNFFSFYLHYFRSLRFQEVWKALSGCAGNWAVFSCLLSFLGYPT